MKTSIYRTIPRTGFRGIVLLTGFCYCMTLFQCSNAQNESVIIGKSSRAFTINSSKNAYQIKIKSTNNLKYDSENKVWLLFNEPEVKQSPEGIYEVYLSLGSLDIEQLDPNSLNFVNVLDVYAATRSEPITLEIGENLKRLLRDDELFPQMTVTILFRGNTYPGGVETDNAGEVSFGGIKLCQER